MAGDQDAYQGPESSFLDSVLERRRGIPITLSVVYVEVAGRIGLHASGIGFPGHFLAKVESDGAEAIVDSFHGCVLSREDCEARLLQMTGQPMPLDEGLEDARAGDAGCVAGCQEAFHTGLRHLGDDLHHGWDVLVGGQHREVRRWLA